MLKSFAIIGVAVCSGLGCTATSQGGPNEPAKSSSGQPMSSGIEAEKFFPLIDGQIYHYRTERLAEGPPTPAGTLVVKVRRTSPTEGQLMRPSIQAFAYVSNGISTTTKNGSPAFLLKTPLDETQTWLGPHGGQTQYQSLDTTITTDAGSFTGCLVTIEQRAGDLPLRVLTTLCPTVGIVRLEVQQGAVMERVELVYYGAPIDIGPDGLTTTTNGDAP